MEKVLVDRPRPHFLIADDQAIFAEALSFLLEQTYSVIGVVPDGRAMVSEAIRLRPDVIIAEIGMPLLNGLDAARRISEQAPTVKFIFLTTQDNSNFAAAALELGAIGFVLKHSGVRELRKAIDQVLRGKSYLTPKLTAEDWFARQAKARQFSKELTPRQREIVQLTAEGKSNKQIAGLLDLSDKTIEFHKHRIMESFNLKSKADLVLFALKHGLISINVQPSLQVMHSH
jgi:DNA-binding NarL/FixJ family response regulator